MIIPIKDIVYLKIDEVKAGALDTSSRASAVEVAEVLAVGEGVITPRVGDKIFVKSWGIDIVNYEDKKYHFVNQNTGAILATIND